ncbi:MAG TPA: cytochrome c, partial [Novosphingobium sp.]|nr:cytochrome c [Novosphingobium sp.]
KAKAPAYVVPERSHADLSAVSTTGDAARGAASFQKYCQYCHGGNASGTWLPDLRRSPMIATREAFAAVVLEGALEDNGMASFKRFMQPPEVEDIRAYLVKRGKARQIMSAKPAS